MEFDFFETPLVCKGALVVVVLAAVSTVLAIGLLVVVVCACLLLYGPRGLVVCEPCHEVFFVATSAKACGFTLFFELLHVQITKGGFSTRGLLCSS